MRYGSAPITLRVSLLVADWTFRLLIEVADGSRDTPARRVSGEDGGYGLWIIDQLADVYITTDDQGKTVGALMHAKATLGRVIPPPADAG